MRAFVVALLSAAGAIAVAPPEENVEPDPDVPVGNTLTAYVGPRFVTGDRFLPFADVVLADETGRAREGGGVVEGARRGRRGRGAGLGSNAFSRAGVADRGRSRGRGPRTSRVPRARRRACGLGERHGARARGDHEGHPRSRGRPD